jgi:hypothetical protein
MELTVQLQTAKETPEIKALRRFLELTYEQMCEDLVMDGPPNHHMRLQGKAEMMQQLDKMFDRPLAPAQMQKKEA